MGQQREVTEIRFKTAVAQLQEQTKDAKTAEEVISKMGKAYGSDNVYQLAVLEDVKKRFPEVAKDEQKLKEIEQKVLGGKDKKQVEEDEYANLTPEEIAVFEKKRDKELPKNYAYDKGYTPTKQPSAENFLNQNSYKLFTNFLRISGIENFYLFKLVF